MKRLMNLPITQPEPPSTEEEVQEHLRLAYKRRKNVLQHDCQKREEYLEEQVQAIAIATKKKDEVHKVYERLIKQERLKIRWNKINRTPQN